MRGYLLATVIGCLLGSPSLGSEPTSPGEGPKQALVIGVNSYANAPDLEFASSDAQAIGDTLNDLGYGVTFVIDSSCSMTSTTRQIRSTIETWLEALEPQTMAVISFSGHGVTVGDELYLAGRDFDPLSPTATGIPVTDIVHRMEQSNARSKLLLLDACRSGLGRAGLATSGVSGNNRLVERHRPSGGGYSWKSHDFAADRMANLLRNSLGPPSWREGDIGSRDPPPGVSTAVLASCSVGENSYESSQGQHSLFTQHLLQALSGRADADGDQRIRLDELSSYVRDRVTRQAEETYGVAQTPVLETDSSGDSDVVIAQLDQDRIVESVSIQLAITEETDEQLPVEGANVCVLYKSEDGKEKVVSITTTNVDGEAVVEFEVSATELLSGELVMVIRRGDITRACPLGKLQKTQSVDMGWPPAYAVVDLEAATHTVSSAGEQDRLTARSVAALDAYKEGDGSEGQTDDSILVGSLIIALPLTVIALLLVVSSLWLQQRTASGVLSWISRRESRSTGMDAPKSVQHIGSQVEYEVALSFAGEDRQYAEDLAALLVERGVRVFYDAYETAGLWGKDLYQHLQSIYRDRARFCVVMISSSYASKLWTRHELKQAQARAFRECREYILPLRLDDTEVPGINETVGYIDLRSTTIEDVAEAVLAKLKDQGGDLN